MKFRLKRLPLRYSLQLLLLLALMLATLVSLLISLQQGRRELIEAARQHAGREAHHFALIAQSELAEHADVVKRMIMLHAADVDDSNLAKAALVDPQERVIFSFSSGWAGHDATEVVPGWDHHRFNAAVQTDSGDILLDEAHDRVSAFEPFDYPHAAGDPVRKGAVYVEYDLHAAFAGVYVRELRHHVPHLIAALLVFVLLGRWLRRNLTLPIERLSEYTHAIGAGNLDIKLNNGFPGELHELGVNLAGMTAQLRAERQSLIAERDRNQLYLDTVNAIVVALDGEGRIQMLNRKGCDLLGYSEAELKGRNWFHTCLPQPDVMSRGYQEFRKVMAGELQYPEYFEEKIQAKDGAQHLIVWHAGCFKDDQGRICGAICSGDDITASRKAEKTIHALANFDALTGLANRAMLLDRMQTILPFARRQKRQDALIVLNIDRFKTLNDARGQAAGDILLKLVAQRMGEVVREGDLLSRTSGDEFAILLPDLAMDTEDATLRVLHIVEHIRDVLRLPFDLGDEQVTLTVSLGIALFPQSAADTPLDILRRANTALHQAKVKGGGYSAFFENTMDEAAKQRFQVERELRHGIAAGELRLFLQPQMDAQGHMTGAEALVRWQHPVRGLLTPFAFIQIAEESDLIVELGNWVMNAVCELLAQEMFQGRPFRIAVNVSPRQFRHHGFADGVLKLLHMTGAEPNHLMLEVTEGLMLQDVTQVIATMTGLSATGIHFSVDDFGTGYSSLAYLKRLPINELKIDKTFVQDAPTDPDDAALVEAILSLAQHLHLRVVAEGVETQEQADFLNARGTVIHQGYLFGKPEPAAAVIARWNGGALP